MIKYTSKDEKKIKTILKYRAKGYSLKTIGDIFHITREMVRLIIEQNKNRVEYKNLYEEIEKTNKFLNRHIE